MITTAKMAAWLQAECLVNRWNSWEDDAFRSSSQHASPGSDTFPALWPTFCLSQQLSEHWTTCIYKRKLVWTLWWHKQTAHHIPWIPQIHTRERWVASGPVTHFTQEFDGLCNTTGVSQILHPVLSIRETMWRYHLCTHQHKRDDYKPPWNVLQAAGADIKYTSAVSDLTKATYKSWLHQYSLVSFLWAHQADLVILLQISLVLNIRAATIARKWPKFSDSSLLNVIICVTVNWRSLCCGHKTRC